MRDLVQGRTAQIADPTSLGVPFVEHPDWSHDGRHIVFHIQPRKNDWTESRLIVIESREGRSEFRDLGAGCCPSYSPDDQTIAFLLLSGEVPGEEEGVWLMNSDGTNHGTGAPAMAVPDEGAGRVDRMGGLNQSPDGRFLIFNADRIDRATEATGFRLQR